MPARQRTHPLVLTLAVVFVCSAALMLLLSSVYPENFSDYRSYLTENRPALDFRFDELSEHWTEADVRQRFPSARFECGAVPPEMNLGDWGCRAEISKHNSVGAMSVSFFFREGRLDCASLNIPWWHHKKAVRSILTFYGRPAGFQRQPSAGVRLVGWHLENGSALFFNRDRELNPVAWSTLFWSSKRKCGQGNCFVDGTVGEL